MSTTVSMWLGILFLLLGIAAVLLQAWLWNPKKFWDEENKVTKAPRFWLGVHRWVGYTFFTIYLVMMWEMVPRLWEYQVELPARTIAHAVAAIVLGVLIFTKLAILKFFRYFEEAMPTLGMGILACTVVLATLSVPFAARGTGVFSNPLDEKNVERVRSVMSRLDLGEDLSVDELVAEDGLDRGRQVLVQECVACHDMRTILQKPRSGAAWHRVVDRMLDKPTIFAKPIQEADVPYVTAYLVAITPEIQRSRKQRQSEAGQSALMQAQATSVDLALAGQAGRTPLSAADGDALVNRLCNDCHGLEEVSDHGGDTLEGWNAVVVAMVVDEEAQFTDSEVRDVSLYLAQKYPASGAPSPDEGGAAPAKGAKEAPSPAQAAPEATASAPQKPPATVPAKRAAKPAPKKPVRPPPSRAKSPAAPARGDSDPPAKKPAPVAKKPPSPPAYTGPKPCVATSFSTSTVRSACQNGGQRQAKAVMKALVRRGADRGLKFKCSSCHSNQKSYALKGSGLADFRKLLAR